MEIAQEVPPSVKIGPQCVRVHTHVCVSTHMHVYILLWA